MNEITTIESKELYQEIRQVLTDARKHAYRTINTSMVQAYWQVGKLIVEAQGGEKKAAYGENMLNELATKLTTEFGKGFTSDNLRRMRQFYLTFPICGTVCRKLSWSHIRLLVKVSNDKARQFYAEEAAKAPWSVRQLERQICTQYYERLLSTHRDESEVKRLIKKNRPKNPERFDPMKLVQDPFILEFVGAKEDEAWQESELESAIISHLEEFLLELGRGFAFIGRQKRFTFDGQHFYPDLVFYNVITKNYVIIDLKMKEANYADVGQMQMYVNYFNMEVCTEGDNPTIGIILCAEKNDAVIRYTLGTRKDIGVFSPQYRLTMPTEEELRREIEITRENFKLLHGTDGL